jgi:4-hydroxy-tetrahydrodipicolinate reductase
VAQLDGYKFTIDETHHVSKLDAPSGTAITLREIIEAVRSNKGSSDEVFVASHRVGDAKGEHIVTAVSDSDRLEIRHEIKDRRCLAEGAVRGAEWVAHRSGPYDFREIFDQL